MKLISSQVALVLILGLFTSSSTTPTPGLGKPKRTTPEQFKHYQNSIESEMDAVMKQLDPNMGFATTKSEFTDRLNGFEQKVDALVTATTTFKKYMANVNPKAPVGSAKFMKEMLDVIKQRYKNCVENEKCDDLKNTLMRIKGLPSVYNDVIGAINKDELGNLITELKEAFPDFK